MNKKNSLLLQAIVVLAIIGVAIGAYTMTAKKVVPKVEEQKEQIVATSTSPAPSVSATSTVKKVSDVSQPSAWKTYTSDTYGFSFQYPSLSKVTIASSSSSVASTVVLKLQDTNISYAGNGKAISFQVYEKGSFIQYSEASKCASFERTTLTVDGKTMDIVEHEKCASDNSGVISSTHYTHALISLSDKEDIVFTASLGQLPFGQSAFVNTILKTFKFIPRT